MTEPQQISVVKFALGGIAVALILNLIMRFQLNLGSAYVILPIPIVAATVVAWWFSKATGRSPTKKEQSLMLWTYGGIIAATFIIIALLQSMKAGINFPTAFIYLLYFLPYPAFLQYFLSEKAFTTYFVRSL